MSHASTAAKARREKEAHPERFCADPRCLWRVQTKDGPRPCPKHPVPLVMREPACSIYHGVLLWGNGQWRMPCDGASIERFATVPDAIASLAAIYGADITVVERSVGALGTATCHHLSLRVDGTGVRVLEYPAARDVKAHR